MMIDVVDWTYADKTSNYTTRGYRRIPPMGYTWKRRRDIQRKRLEDKRKTKCDRLTLIYYLRISLETTMNGVQFTKIYKKKYQTSYMPISNCLFLRGPIVNGSHIPAGYDIVRKANLYKTAFDNNGLDFLTPIHDPFLFGPVKFADENVSPNNHQSFDKWYRSLPIHKMFTIGKEDSIYYLAPDALQPKFPFVYLDWKVDCKASSDDDTL